MRAVSFRLGIDPNLAFPKLEAAWKGITKDEVVLKAMPKKAEIVSLAEQMLISMVEITEITALPRLLFSLLFDNAARVSETLNVTESQAMFVAPTRNQPFVWNLEVLCLVQGLCDSQESFNEEHAIRWHGVIPAKHRVWSAFRNLAYRIVHV